MIFTLFGATGNLAEHKIMPALCALCADKKLPPDSTIIAFSRRPWSDEEYHAFIKPSLQHAKFTPEIINAFLKRVLYVQGTFDTEKSFEKLKEKISSISKNSDTQHEHIYHLSVEPKFYATIFKALGESGLAENPAGIKLIIEKPFGNDLASAEALEKVLLNYFTEEQVYRIDHYLGKSALVELMGERFTDTELELHLNAEHVTEIKIRFLEDISIQGRGDFYDSTGAWKDVGQSHVIQMLAVLTFNLHNTKTPHELPKNRAALINELRPAITEKYKRAQYYGYEEEEGVSAKSKTETYFFVHAEIKSNRWKGVPVIFEGGKAMPEKCVEISLIFKDGSNKVWSFHTDATGHEAYEVLLDKAMGGDKSFFVSSEEIMASWKFSDEVSILLTKMPLTHYKKHTHP